MFENGGEPLLLYPYTAQEYNQALRAAESCVPLVCDAERVEPTWRSLAARAESLGLAPQATDATNEPMLCIRAGGRTFRPVSRIGGRYQFVFPELRNDARLISRGAVPSDMRPWVDDPRMLGVAIQRIVVWCGSQCRDVALDNPRLTDGWWDVERDGANFWRWTNGDASLPIEGDRVMLEIAVIGTVPYPMTSRCPEMRRAV